MFFNIKRGVMLTHVLQQAQPVEPRSALLPIHTHARVARARTRKVE